MVAPGNLPGCPGGRVGRLFSVRYAYARQAKRAEEPLVLILQGEYIDEPEPGRYIHVKKKRIAEWPPEFLTRPRRNEHTIPDFMSPDAPDNKLDILHGLA